MLQLLDAGKDVIVVPHSYGGVLGGGAAHALSKLTRAREGRATGVIGLVYVVAFPLDEGVSLLDLFDGGKSSEAFTADSVSLRSSLPFTLS